MCSKAPNTYLRASLELVYRLIVGIKVYQILFLLVLVHGNCEARVLTLGLLVPHNGSRSFGPEVEDTMDMALEKVRHLSQLFIVIMVVLGNWNIVNSSTLLKTNTVVDYQFTPRFQGWYSDPQVEALQTRNC